MTPDSSPAGPQAPDADIEQELAAEGALLSNAIGGWRGIVDSSAASLVFVVAYLVSGHRLDLAVWCAVATGVAVMVWRLARHQSVQQVLAGFLGVAVSAWLASRTGQAEDFFLPGLLINAAYAAAFLVSILVRWPLLGFVVGSLTGDPIGWHADAGLRRVYAAASWIWVAVFGLRLLVQVPLYLAGAVGLLGVAKIVLGWPLYLLGAYLSYRVVAPVLAARRHAEAVVLGIEAPDDAPDGAPGAAGAAEGAVGGRGEPAAEAAGGEAETR